MANRLLESFDWIASGLSSADFTRVMGANEFYALSGATAANVETGRFGYGKALLFSTAANGARMGYVAPLGVTPAEGFIGCGMIVYPDQTDNAGPALQFYDAVANVPQLTVLFRPNGVIRVYRGDATGQTITGTLLASSAAGAYQENQYFHCEVNGLIASSGGGCEVRINTVPKLQLTGANTQNSTNAYFDSACVNCLKATSDNVHFAIDDLFCNDTTGANNNSWSGNMRIYGMFMIANGATDNFSIGGSAPAATNWQSVLNQNLDDTKYVYSPNVGDIDLYQPNPVVNGPLVRVLQVRAALRQDDATQRVGRLLIRIGSTNYIGTVDQFTNQSFTMYKDRFELSPATGVTFTGSEVNGLQAGIKVQA